MSFSDQESRPQIHDSVPKHDASPRRRPLRRLSFNRGRLQGGYAWAWIGTASPRHSLLVRRHLKNGELAFQYCFVPGGQLASKARLIRAAGLRWPAEESFELGKGCFGLDQCQARLYTAILRHIVLVMAALAVCAVTAAQLRDRTGTQAPPPGGPVDRPPASPCRIACKWWYAGFHWAPEGDPPNLLTRITSSWTVNSPLAASPLDTGACASHQRLYLGETGRLIGGWARTGRSRLGSAAKRDRAQAVGGCCCRVEPDDFSGSAQPATLTARSDCRVPGVST